MHKRNTAWMTFAAGAVGIFCASCNGGGHAEGRLGDTSFFCDTMYDDGPAVDYACVDCSVEHAERASDEDLYSYASVKILTSAETQGASIKEIGRASCRERVS
jgi:hypothetical protein